MIDVDFPSTFGDMNTATDRRADAVSFAHLICTSPSQIEDAHVVGRICLAQEDVSAEIAMDKQNGGVRERGALRGDRTIS